MTTDVKIASASSSAVMTDVPSVTSASAPRHSRSLDGGLGAAAGRRLVADADERCGLTDGDGDVTAGCGGGDVINSKTGCPDITAVVDVESAAATDDTNEVDGRCLSGDVDLPAALLGCTVTGDSSARTQTVLFDDCASPSATECPEAELLRW